ncbi:probable transporter Mch2p [Trichomonascus vanleenenianus]|uniref:putative transporter Mch2p n=1 Tax=Trichomonascus vanleenenianus TaxID=2268995 RepID=UPI003ECA2D94
MTCEVLSHHRSSIDEEEVDIGICPSPEKQAGAAAFCENCDDDSAAKELEPPPDGGWYAWLQVAIGFFAYMNSFGLNNAFGVFQKYYVDGLLSDQTPSTVAWIGSTQGLIILGGTIFTGRLLDGGYLRPVMWTGVVAEVFGLMMTSLSTQWYQIFLAQGICTGLGGSCIVGSTLTVVAPYFSKRRSFALGIIACGASMGTIIFPIVFENLIDKIGFPWTVRVIGFMALAMLLPPAMLFRSRVPPRKKGAMIDVASLKEPAFLLISFATFFGFMGLYIPMIYIQSYAKAVGLDSKIGEYMLTILGAATLFGRVIPNKIADKIGPVNMMVVCGAAVIVLAFCWCRIQSQAGVLAFAILFGFFSGCYGSLPPACVTSITRDISLTGTRISMAFFISSFGYLSGPPIAGALINSLGGSYLGAQMFSGCALLVATVLFVSAKIIIAEGELWKKA